MLSMHVRIRLALILTTGGLLCLSVLILARELRAQEQQSTSLPPGPAPPRPGRVTPDSAIITYQNDELTIEAQNATLSDVLREVCSQTGAVIDFPSGVDERVFGRWGPGPARDVVASLLQGTPFNYVLGSGDNQDALAQIILFEKSPDPATAKVSAQKPTRPTALGPSAAIQRGVVRQQGTEQHIQAADAAHAASGGKGGAQNPTAADSPVMDNQTAESSPPQSLAEIAAPLSKQIAASEIPVDPSTTGSGTPADQSAAGPGNSGDNQGTGQMPTVPRRRRRH